MMDLKKCIRDIPDFPKKGILFHDVTTLFGNAKAFAFVMQKFLEKYQDQDIDHVVAIEARGFIIGGALAHQLGCGFVPIRKPGKLPADTLSQSYELEYGTDTMEIHKGAIQPGDKVLVVDDLVATGGTLLAGIRLVEQLKGQVTAVATIIDMPGLGGREKLHSYDYFYLVEYQGE